MAAGKLSIVDINNFKITYTPEAGASDRAAILPTNIASLDTTQTFDGLKTFSGQITSSVATGTSPFSIASTTLVTNLNANYLSGASLSTDTALGTSDTLIPTQNAIKTYVDANAGGGVVSFQSANTGATANQYTRIARVTLTTQYSDYNASINYTVGGHSQAGTYAGILNIRVKQQLAFGNNPEMECNQINLNGGIVSFGYVIVQNTPTTIVDFYVYITTGYAEINAGVSSDKNSDYCVYYSNDTISTTQPTGWVAGTKRIKFDAGSWGDNKTPDGTHFVLEGIAPSIYFDQTDSADSNAYLGVNGGTMFILQDINSDGIYETPYAMQLDLSAGAVTFAGNVTAYSDERLKENLKVIDNPIEKILQISGYTYKRKDTSQIETGVIAQEVQQVLPEVVGESENGILSVAYGNMAGLFVEAIKAQQEQINEMKKEIQLLKGE